ncbi:MAG: molybdopterin-binding protein [Candidatus Bathyarchaeota archaeon]|nr:molybdopterin-binding protein [Candidatus Bathyarchaeota archaeon]
MTVDVEVICIGNELLIGKIENTNAYWLAKQITALGANLRRVTVIQDVIDEIAACIQEVACRKPRFIITTGGLGPTFDDKTFQGIAKALNQKLAVNADAYETVKRKCTEFAKNHGMPGEVEMTPPRVKMAIFPETTQPVNNPIGTAPALRAQIGETVLYALPGVPAEMKAIFTESIAAEIRVAGGDCVFCECSVFSDGVVESRLAPLIDRVMAEYRGVYVKSHPMGCNRVELHLTMMSKNGEPNGWLEKAAGQLRALIAENGGKTRT